MASSASFRVGKPGAIGRGSALQLPIPRFPPEVNDLCCGRWVVVPLYMRRRLSLCGMGKVKSIYIISKPWKSVWESDLYIIKWWCYLERALRAFPFFGWAWSLCYPDRQDSLVHNWFLFYLKAFGNGNFRVFLNNSSQGLTVFIVKDKEAGLIMSTHFSQEEGELLVIIWENTHVHTYTHIHKYTCTQTPQQAPGRPLNFPQVQVWWSYFRGNWIIFVFMDLFRPFSVPLKVYKDHMLLSGSLQTRIPILLSLLLVTKAFELCCLDALWISWSACVSVVNSSGLRAITLLFCTLICVV